MTEPNLQTALLGLDPAVDSHWTQGGEPLMSHLEDLLPGTNVSRADVDAITGGLKRSDTWAADLSAKLSTETTSPDDAPTSEPVVPPRASGLAVSTLTRRMPAASDRARSVSVGQVVQQQGKDLSPVTLLVEAVGGNGQIDGRIQLTGETVVGLLHKSVVDQTPADDPARNLPYWDYAS